MASPQVEDGYTRFANTLIEALMAFRVPGQELRIVLAVARKTYGWQKTTDTISYGQLSSMTDIPRARVIEHVKSLVSKKILGSHNNGTRQPLTLWINKDFEQWQSSPKKETSPKHETKPSPNNGDRTSPNNGTHKRKERKERKGNVTLPPEKFMTMAQNYYEHLQQKFPQRNIQSTNGRVHKGAETLRKLEEIDEYDLERHIKPALRWALEDDFWHDKVLSLAELRKKKSGSENHKFFNLFQRYMADTKKKQPDNEVAL